MTHLKYRMSNLMNEKLKNICSMLLEHDLTIVGDVNDDLKCMLCKNVLINAVQAVCGCNFCERCVNEYVENGGSYCPGHTDECKSDDLTNILPDNKTNRQITRLLVRCNEKDCAHECELVDMEKHLENCSKKKLKCPFNDVGCEREKMSCELMNEHLHVENYSHNKLLIETINTMRNEMRDLRENDEKNKEEIMKLKKYINCNIEETEVKDEKVSSISLKHVDVDELKKIKIEDCGDEEGKKKGVVESENMGKIKTNKLDGKIEEENLLKKIDLLSSEMNFMKTESQKFLKEINILKEKLSKQMLILNENDGTSDLSMTTRVNKLEKYLDVRDGVFSWHIGRIDKLHKNQYMFSDYFYGRHEFYKFGLRLWYSDKDLNIYLLIYEGSCDAYMRWPFEANVTIRIVNKFNQNVTKGVTKRCSISRSINHQFQCSDQFKFKKVELSNTGVLVDQSDGIVECIIESL